MAVPVAILGITRLRSFHFWIVARVIAPVVIAVGVCGGTQDEARDGDRRGKDLAVVWYFHAGGPFMLVVLN